MHRTIADANVGGLFDEGDPGVPREPTQLDAKSMNAIQENICQAIEGAGLSLDDGSGDVTVDPQSTQLREAIRRGGYDGRTLTLHVTPHEFVGEMTDGAFIEGASINLRKSEDDNAGYLTIKNNVEVPLTARVKLPMGVTVTGVQAFLYNHADADGSAQINHTVVTKYVPALSGTGAIESAYTYTVALNQTVANTFAADAGGWVTPTGTFSDFVVPDDGFVEVTVGIKAHNGSGVQFGGLRFTYEQFHTKSST